MNIAKQGSNRVYTRETDAEGRSIIRVEGTNRDENRAFIYMARHFAEKGLPVPRVLWVSEDEMSYTQEDLGDTLLFDAIRHGRETGVFDETERTLLTRTIRALAHVQVEGAQDFDWSVCYPVPAMDERAVRWDLNYFKYCFLKGTQIEFSEPKLEDDFDSMVANILSPLRGEPERVFFLYRDFQSRNVMLKDGEPYFIDFQGGRKGPTQYDVASFLWLAGESEYPAAPARGIDRRISGRITNYELRVTRKRVACRAAAFCAAAYLAGARRVRLQRLFRAQTPFPGVHPQRPA